MVKNLSYKNEKKYFQSFIVRISIMEIRSQKNWIKKWKRLEKKSKKRFEDRKK